MVRLDPGADGEKVDALLTKLQRLAGLGRQRGARVGAGGGDDHPAGGPGREGDPGGREVLRRRALVHTATPPCTCCTVCTARCRCARAVPVCTRAARPRPPRAGDAPSAAQPIVFWPSIVSRMMSACPACWAVSATMCRNTRRAERVAPGANHGAVGSGCAVSRSGATRRGRRCARRPARRRRATPARVSSGSSRNSFWPLLDHLRARVDSPSIDGIASVPRSMKSAHRASVAATCLISPPRVSSLAVGDEPGLLVGQALDGVTQEVPVRAQGLQEVGPLPGGARSGEAEAAALAVVVMFVMGQD